MACQTDRKLGLDGAGGMEHNYLRINILLVANINTLFGMEHNYSGWNTNVFRDGTQMFFGMEHNYLRLLKLGGAHYVHIYMSGRCWERRLGDGTQIPVNRTTDKIIILDILVMVMINSTGNVCVYIYIYIYIYIYYAYSIYTCVCIYIYIYIYFCSEL